MLVIRRIVPIALIILGISQHAAAQWQNIGPSSGATALAFAADASLYAVVYDPIPRGVYRLNPQTLMWEPRNGGVADQLVTSLIADPRSPGTLYAGSLGGVAGGSRGGVFKTTDSGVTWTLTSNGPDYVRALAIDPADPATLYAGTQSGLFKSVDAAGHWAPANTGLIDKSIVAIAIDPRNTSTVYVGAGIGIAKSNDRGSSWRAINTGLPAPLTAAGFAIDPSNTSTIYIATWAPSQAVPFEAYVGDGVYKSTNGGESWMPVYNGFFPGGMHSVVIDPRSPSTVYAIRPTFQAPGVVVRTTDGGASWVSISAGLPYLATGLAVDPAIAGTVYAGTSAGVFKFATAAPCAPGAETLCLNNGRFKVQVHWRVGSQGTGATGQAVSMTADTGSFWFFSSNNVELVVKVVDGRAFNNKFWVFYGALTNVEYTVTVTDTQTGVVKTYFNPQGQLASVADTAAF